MENEKLCEYLSDIGVLLFDNIDLFLNIYSTNDSKQFKSEQEKLKNSLFLYLQKTTKNDNYLNEMSNHLIETFYNNQAINEYKIIKNFVNILNHKLFSRYNLFLVKISQYIINNASMKKNENENKNNLDDVIKISEKNDENEKIKIKSKRKNKNKTKKVNQYKNNWYRNINDDGVVQHGFFINNDDSLDKINYNNNYDDVENFDNNFKNFKNNNYNFNNRYEEENLNNYNYPNNIDNYKSSEIPINYYIPKYNTNNNNYYLEDDQDIKIPFAPYINSNTELSSPCNRNYDFFENQENFEQKVKIKLLNLENEKEINLLKQCPFNPKTNSQRPHGSIPKQVIDNKFEKLYNDSILNKIKKDEKIKKHFEDLKFKPNLKKTENYVISSTFEERLKNSIDMKKKLKNNVSMTDKKTKGYENKINKKEEKKKSVIDWEKVTKENNEKNKNENKYHYGNMMEKKKKNLENIGNKISINNANNIVTKESLNINNKSKNDYNEENSKEKEDEKENISKNNEINLNDNKNEDEQKNDENEIKANINENYQSSSIKNLLKNNNLFKKDY